MVQRRLVRLWRLVRLSVPERIGRVGRGTEGGIETRGVARQDGRTRKRTQNRRGNPTVASPMDALATMLESGAFKRQYRDHRLEWMMRSGGVEVVLEGLRK